MSSTRNSRAILASSKKGPLARHHARGVRKAITAATRAINTNTAWRWLKYQGLPVRLAATSVEAEVTITQPTRISASAANSSQPSNGWSRVDSRARTPRHRLNLTLDTGLLDLGLVATSRLLGRSEEHTSELQSRP